MSTIVSFTQPVRNLPIVLISATELLSLLRHVEVRIVTKPNVFKRSVKVITRKEDVIIRQL